jgi:hypothetical protein
MKICVTVDILLCATEVQSNLVIMTSVYGTLVYSIRYSMVPINSSLLTITLYSLVITTLVYNNIKY